MNTSRNQSTDTSFDDVTLDQLNYERIKDTYGTLIIVGVLMLPGIVGNSHILHIYFKKKPKNSTRVLVFFLAATDLITCLICFPAILVNFSIPLKIFEKFDPFCRILTFITVYVFVCEALSLLAIAIDRYRHVCHPFGRQMTTSHAKMVCALILFLALIGATPVLALYGSTASATRHPDITSYECEVLTHHRKSWFEKVYFGLMLLCSIVTSSSMSVLFLLTVRRLRQHQARINEMEVKYAPTFALDKDKDVNDETRGQGSEMVENIAVSAAEPNEAGESVESVAMQMVSQDDDDDGEDDDCSVNADNDTDVMKTFDKAHKGKGESSKTPLKKTEIDHFKKIKKSIYMLTVVTVLYITSYIPYPLLRLAKGLETEWFKNLSYTVRVLMLTTHSFLFFNNVSNALIYIIFDPMFRQELKSFYGKLFCRR